MTGDGRVNEFTGTALIYSCYEANYQRQLQYIIYTLYTNCKSIIASYPFNHNVIKIVIKIDLLRQ